MARGLHELLTGHPLAALRLNLVLAVMVPVSLYAYAAWVLRGWGRRPLPAIRLTPVRVSAVIAVLLAFSVVRNLPWEPFRSFSSLQ
jgi:hypothetical protein